MSEYRNQHLEDEQNIVNEFQETAEGTGSVKHDEYPDTYNDTGEYPVVEDDIAPKPDENKDSYERIP